MPKPNNALLVKGVACTALGLAVVAAPYVVPSPSIRTITSSVSLVGWFVLALGAMMILRYIRAQRPKAPKKPLTSPVLKQRPPP
jgi:uncharacterized membrane protein HdeD (DUF308 family)